MTSGYGEGVILKAKGALETRYEKLRKRLDDSGYLQDVFSLDSLAIVEHLFNDLEKTTESLEKCVQQYKYYKKIADEFEVGIGPFKEKNVQLIKENSVLRMEVLRTKERMEEDHRETKSKLKDLESDNSDLKLLMNQFVSRVKNLESENWEKAKAIGLLKGNNIEQFCLDDNDQDTILEMEINCTPTPLCPHCTRIRNHVEFGKGRDPQATDYIKIADSRIEALQVQIRKLKGGQKDMTEILSSMKQKVEDREAEIEKLRGIVKIRPGRDNEVNGNMNFNSNNDQSDKNLALALKAAEMQLQILQRRNINLEKKLKTSILQEHDDFMRGRNNVAAERELLSTLIDINVDKYPYETLTMQEKIGLLEAQLSHCCKEKAKLKSHLEYCEMNHRRSQWHASPVSPGRSTSVIFQRDENERKPAVPKQNFNKNASTDFKVSKRSSTSVTGRKGTHKVDQQTSRPTSSNQLKFVNSKLMRPGLKLSRGSVKPQNSKNLLATSVSRKTGDKSKSSVQLGRSSKQEMLKKPDVSQNESEPSEDHYLPSKVSSGKSGKHKGTSDHNFFRNRPTSQTSVSSISKFHHSETNEKARKGQMAKGSFQSKHSKGSSKPQSSRVVRASSVPRRSSDKSKSSANFSRVRQEERKHHDVSSSETELSEGHISKRSPTTGSNHRGLSKHHSGSRSTSQSSVSSNGTSNPSDKEATEYARKRQMGKSSLHAMESKLSRDSAKTKKSKMVPAASSVSRKSGDKITPSPSVQLRSRSGRTLEKQDASKSESEHSEGHYLPSKQSSAKRTNHTEAFRHNSRNRSTSKSRMSSTVRSDLANKGTVKETTEMARKSQMVKRSSQERSFEKEDARVKKHQYDSREPSPKPRTSKLSASNLVKALSQESNDSKIREKSHRGKEHSIKKSSSSQNPFEVTDSRETFRHTESDENLYKDPILRRGRSREDGDEQALSPEISMPASDGSVSSHVYEEFEQYDTAVKEYEVKTKSTIGRITKKKKQRDIHYAPDLPRDEDEFPLSPIEKDSIIYSSNEESANYLEPKNTGIRSPLSKTAAEQHRGREGGKPRNEMTSALPFKNAFHSEEERKNYSNKQSEETKDHRSRGHQSPSSAGRSTIVTFRRNEDGSKQGELKQNYLKNNATTTINESNKMSTAKIRQQEPHKVGRQKISGANSSNQLKSLHNKLERPVSKFTKGSRKPQSSKLAPEVSSHKTGDKSKSSTQFRRSSTEEIWKNPDASKSESEFSEPSKKSSAKISNQPRGTSRHPSQQRSTSRSSVSSNGNSHHSDKEARKRQMVKSYSQEQLSEKEDGRLSKHWYNSTTPLTKPPPSNLVKTLSQESNDSKIREKSRRGRDPSIKNTSSNQNPFEITDPRESFIHAKSDENLGKDATVRRSKSREDSLSSVSNAESTAPTSSHVFQQFDPYHGIKKDAAKIKGAKKDNTRKKIDTGPTHALLTDEIEFSSTHSIERRRGISSDEENPNYLEPFDGRTHSAIPTTVGQRQGRSDSQPRFRDPYEMMIAPSGNSFKSSDTRTNFSSERRNNSVEDDSKKYLPIPGTSGQFFNSKTTTAQGYVVPIVDTKTFNSNGNRGLADAETVLKDNDRLKAQIYRKEEDLDRLNIDYEILERRVKSLQVEVDDKRHSLPMAAQAVIKRMEEEKAHLESFLHQHQTQLTETERKAARRDEKATSELRALQNQLRELERLHGSCKLEKKQSNMSMTSLEDELRKLRRELSEAQADGQQWRMEAQRAKLSVEQTERLLSEVQKRASGSSQYNPQRENMEMAQQIRQYATREKDLETDLGNMRAAVKSLDRDKDEMRVELDRKDEKLASMVHDCSEHMDEIARLQLKLKNFELQVGHTGETTREQDREIQVLRRQIETLRKDLELVTREREDALRELRHFKGAKTKGDVEKRSMETEFERVSNESVDLRKQIQKYIDEVRRIEDLLLQKDEELNTLLEHYRTLTVEKSSLEYHRSSLEREVSSNREGVREALDQNSALELQIASQESLVKSYEEEIERLSQRIATLENKFANALAQEKSLETDSKAARELIRRLETSMDKYKLDTANMESMKNQVEAENRDLQAHLDILQAELNREQGGHQDLKQLLSTHREEEQKVKARERELTVERDQLIERINLQQNRTEAMIEELSRYRLKATELQSELERSKRQHQIEKVEKDAALTDLRRLQENLNTSSMSNLIANALAGTSSLSSSQRGSGRTNPLLTTSFSPSDPTTTVPQEMASEGGSGQRYTIPTSENILTPRSDSEGEPLESSTSRAPVAKTGVRPLERTPESDIEDI